MRNDRRRLFGDEPDDAIGDANLIIIQRDW
jgi:hypothetical protein